MSQSKHSKSAQTGQEGDGMEVQPGDVTGCYYLLIGGVSCDQPFDLRCRVLVLIPLAAEEGYYMEGCKGLPALWRR